MIYDIRHVTTYSYESPVSFARCTLRLEPVSGDGQKLVTHSVEIRPRPAERTSRHDFFGIADREHLDRNPAPPSAHRFALAGFGVPPRAGPDRVKSGMGERARRGIRGHQPRPGFADRLRLCEPAGAGAGAGHRICVGELSPGRRNSRRRGRSDAPHPHRVQIRSEGDRDLDAAQGSVREAPRRLPGFCPCDDRGPARPWPAGRLCPGYLRTIPPPGKPRLQGADATHAWVSLWCGAEIGWVGLDPTNDILVANDHIVLAVGRDFSDVSPVDGIIVGSRKQKLAVAVDVLLVE